MGFDELDFVQEFLGEGDSGGLLLDLAQFHQHCVLECGLTEFPLFLDVLHFGEELLALADKLGLLLRGQQAILLGLDRREAEGLVAVGPEEVLDDGNEEEDAEQHEQGDELVLLRHLGLVELLELLPQLLVLGLGLLGLLPQQLEVLLEVLDVLLLPVAGDLGRHSVALLLDFVLVQLLVFVATRFHWH